MNARSWWPMLATALATLCPVLPGCEAPPAGCRSVGGIAGTCAIGDACTDSLDCASSSCDDGVCAESCTSARDCLAGEICVAFRDGRGTRRTCSAVCPPEPFHVVGDTNGLVCVGGELQRCGDLVDPGPMCDLCPCGVGRRCVVPGGSECRTATSACACVSPAAVGEPCTSNVGCISFNCSGVPGDPARRCQIAAGTPCDASSVCVHCDEPVETGGEGCRQSCERDADCLGAVCAPRIAGEPACYVDCTIDGRCPDGQTCVVFEGDPRGRRYCAPS